jgi:hypothetical protein
VLKNHDLGLAFVCLVSTLALQSHGEMLRDVRNRARVGNFKEAKKLAKLNLARADRRIKNRS